MERRLSSDEAIILADPLSKVNPFLLVYTGVDVPGLQEAGKLPLLLHRYPLLQPTRWGRLIVRKMEKRFAGSNFLRGKPPSHSEYEIQVPTRLVRFPRALDDHLKELYTNGIISYEAMLEVAQDPRDLAERAAKPGAMPGAKPAVPAAAVLKK